jgi:hypothetical protein
METAFSVRFRAYGARFRVLAEFLRSTEVPAVQGLGVSVVLRPRAGDCVFVSTAEERRARLLRIEAVDLSPTLCQLIGFRKSTPPQNRQIIVLISNCTK